MAQYSTDFSELSTGSGVPSGWTARWVTSNLTWTVSEETMWLGASRKFLSATLTAGQRSLLSWDVIDSDGDRETCEVLMLSRCNVVNVAGGHDGVVMLATNSAGNETGYVAGRFSVATSIAGMSYWRYTSGTFVEISNTQTGGVWTWTANQWRWLRAGKRNGVCYMHTWNYGDPEPSGFQYEGANSNITADGWVGIFMSGLNTTCDFAYFSVGTNGDVAPAPPPIVSPGGLKISGGISRYTNPFLLVGGAR